MSENDPRMTEPVIVCPNCKTEIKLTESLAAPLIESTRKQFEQRLSEKDVEVAKREQTLEEKLAGQRQVEALEVQRNEKRRSLFDARDKVNAQLDALIAQIEGKLQQSVRSESLFNARWRTELAGSRTSR